MCYTLANYCFKILEETNNFISIQLPNDRIIHFENTGTYQYKEVKKDEKEL